MKDFTIHLSANAKDLVDALTDEELTALEWLIQEERAKRLKGDGENLTE